jgi:hypothetical protein
MIKMLKESHYVVYVVHQVTEHHNALDEDKKTNKKQIKNK